MQRWRKLLSLALVLCLAALLGGCGGEPTAAGGSAYDTERGTAEPAGGAEELTEYAAEGVATFYLPEGFELESGTGEMGGMPVSYATLRKDSITVEATRYGADAYEAAGVPLPADLEEYAQRPGVKAGLPEGTEFAEDSYGNLFAEYPDPENSDQQVYYVLKQGTESFGALTVTCPADEFGDLDAALWASRAQLQ